MGRSGQRSVLLLLLSLLLATHPAAGYKGNPYKVLGLERGATMQDIKKAYRKMAGKVPLSALCTVSSSLFHRAL